MISYIIPYFADFGNKKDLYRCTSLLAVEKTDLQIQLYADAHWASLQIGCFACINVGTTIGRPQIAMVIDNLKFVQMYKSSVTLAQNR